MDVRYIDRAIEKVLMFETATVTYEAVIYPRCPNTR